MPVTASCGRQVLFRISSALLVRHRLGVAGERHARTRLHRPGWRRRLAPASGDPAGICDEQFGQFHLAGGFVLDARQQLRRMRKDDGTMPLAAPECTPSVSTRTVRLPITIAAQGCGQPQLLVIAATGIQAHHQIGRADARRQMIDIEGQVGRAGFLASLDQDHGAGMGDALFLQRQQRREAGEHGIAVIGAAAAIKLAVLQHRLPGPVPSAQPIISGCLSRWPYIRTVPAALPGTSMKISGVRPWQPHHFQRRAGKLLQLLARPGGEHRHGLVPYGRAFPSRDRRPGSCWECGCNRSAPGRSRHPRCGP